MMMALMAHEAARETAMIQVNDVAKYFLSKTDEDAGDTISNLKLQKLLYYAQGFHLALTGEPLFLDRIEAWRHGPVVRNAYPMYADHGSRPIPPDPEFDPNSIDQDVAGLLDEVYDVYGQFSAWRLREMTHAEPPWSDAWDPNSGTGQITFDAMRQYFSTLVDEPWDD